MSSKFFTNNYDNDESDDCEDCDDSNNNNLSDTDDNNSNDNDKRNIIEKVNNSEKNDSKHLQNIDKLITLRYIKDGKAARTYIDGLEYFVSDISNISKIVKEIQKKLSTGYFKDKETNNHGFNGDHKLKIEKLLVNTYSIPKNKIKIC